MINRCAIIGVGLMGGSMALALNERKLAQTIVGCDINKENIKMALAAGAIHESAGLEAAVRNAELVLLATPVGTTTAILCEIKDYLNPGTVVTDMGSTKQTVVEQAEEIIQGGWFVGGHPMAGAETSGFDGADPYLFENAYYLLTPTCATNPSALNFVRQLAEAIGALVVEMPPSRHDLVAATISHLPHLVAAALVDAVALMPDSEGALAFAAGGFRDTTRIAAGSPEMWRDIFLSNHVRVLDALGFYRRAITEMELAIKNRDSDKIYEILSHASNLRKGLPVKSKGYLPNIYEVVVTVPDRPGIIAMLAGLLGDAGINIYEIEILRAREGYGGTIRIGFATPEEQQQAIELLQQKNIRCRRKG
ncbi:prephenate dehydrogenase [Desulfotomaculum arcticum]|uniref:Prephenate dehydrogenase n=1 Tax=Desulfotruncus arcticus DSM 17038 TaxID=1121424 RepID=A0A1I2MT41_9FIRM|nr:prephenate dehydrogenase [Desulfotruncus arcticus]SFF94745.1 prephenate dehydrogenase [Desulfotomaculum arcticum] [Desulfotruncus arcticus DSM 17038]